MKRLIVALALMFATLSAAPAVAQPEAAMHPRIATAIKHIEEAVAYMKAAPHNFGGHKAAAIADCERAIIQLRKALAFRAREDRKRR